MADKSVPEAATAAKSSQEMDINPRITDVHVKIKNSDVMLKLAQKMKAVGIKDIPPKPNRQNDWFQRIQLNNKSESSNAADFTIDVQPDFRFPFAYIVYKVVQHYPSYDLKSHPNISIYTMIMYEQIMFSAFLLLQDDLCRRIKSAWCQTYTRNPEKRDYLNLLQNLQVSSELAEIIECFASVYDPARLECEFIPSLSGGSFKHDFGRLIPPQIFLLMHNLISELRTNVPIEEILRTFYNTHICTVENEQFNVTHFLGGYFLTTEGTCAYNHWIREIVETVFNPAIGRTNVQRPTLARIPFTPQICIHAEPNLYDLLLNYNEEDYPRMASLMSSLSTFFASEKDIPSVPLLSVLEKVGGITTMTHTIETLTLPTWHHLASPTTPITKDATVATLTTSEYAKNIGLFQKPAKSKLTGAIPYPKTADETSWNPKFYLVKQAVHNQNNSSIEFIEFEHARHINPDVFVFQPYERSIQRAALSLTLGIKIQCDEIDAVPVPLPNTLDSLHDNNSCYMSGSLPITYIKPIIPNSTLGNMVIERESDSHMINGLAIRDGGQNILPIFDATNITPSVELPHGFSVEESHALPQYAYTYSAWKSQKDIKFAKTSKYIWSSYRHVEHSNNARNRNIHMYYTFRPMYGTSIPLTKIRNPAMIANIR